MAESRLKVLHVGKFYPPHMGGIETHLQALCGELRHFVDLEVVVANDGNRSEEGTMHGVPLCRVATRRVLASTPICPDMAAKIRQSNSDIIHLHLPNPMAVLAYLLSGHKGKLVVTYHSDTVRQKVLSAMFAPFLHWVLRRSSAIIATSSEYLRTSPILTRYADRCKIIPYGIALESFEQPDPNQVLAIRRKLGDRLIVSVGRLIYYKGFEVLIRAMNDIRGKLLVVGDGPLRSSLQQQVAAQGIGDRVFFLGNIPNEAVVPYYHAGDVFALASVARSEAFGIVQIEAMAAGIPVVNTRLDSGVPFVSLDGKTGLTVTPGDSVALAAAVNRLLDDDSLRRSYGTAGRLRARQEFSLETMTRRTIDLYREVTMSGGSPTKPPRRQTTSR